MLWELRWNWFPSTRAEVPNYGNGIARRSHEGMQCVFRPAGSLQHVESIRLFTSHDSHARSESVTMRPSRMMGACSAYNVSTLGRVTHAQSISESSIRDAPSVDVAADWALQADIG